MDISEHLKQIPTGDLFHYTNPADCIGILSNREFWATQIQFMNDSKEVLQAADVARKIISENYQNRASKKFLEHMGFSLDSMHGANTFIVSFSEHEDQLSQWRAYCSDGGVSIGFSFSGIKRLLSRNSGFRLLKCIYDDELQKHYIKEIVENAFISYESSPNDDTYSITRITSSLFHPQLLMIATSVKHKSFKEEAEWRLVGGPFTFKDPRMGWRPGKDMIIPFLKFSLGDTPPIVSACSGPARQPVDAGRSMGSLIKSQPWWAGDTVRLSRTKTPFRRQ